MGAHSSAESLRAAERRRGYVAEWITDFNAWFAESLSPGPHDAMWEADMCVRKATLLGRASWLFESELGEVSGE